MTERAVKLLNALRQARVHVAAAGAMPAGADARNELLSALECTLAALEISAGVVYHGKQRNVTKVPPAAAAPGSSPGSS